MIASGINGRSQLWRNLGSAASERRGYITRRRCLFVARRTGRQGRSPADEAGAPMTIGRKAPAEMDRAKAQRGMIDKTTPLYVVCSPRPTCL